MGGALGFLSLPVMERVSLLLLLGFLANLVVGRVPRTGALGY